MDQSILRLPDPVAGAPHGERRRNVRQKLHTPVYASFNGPQTGMVVDLSELLDLHEEGFAVQTSERLEMNRAVTLCLDLPETKSYIHGSGQVIWSDDTGRGGIRFSALPESSRQILKEWLFANLLIACSNHAARKEQLARREEEKLSEPEPVTEAGSVVPISDQSGTLSSLEAVEAVGREIVAIGDDVDAVLQLVTERALNLTGASGAALAFLTDFLTDYKMICRARAGEPAPPLGAPVDVREGLSGECVRSGLLVSCEDMENDPRIDPEIGRTLGIGSFMAAPVASDFQVVGLLEVFSPHPHRFTKAHGTILNQLVEMIPEPHREKAQPESVAPEMTQPETPVRAEAVSDASPPPASDSGLIEFESIQALREALWEREPEFSEQVSPPLPEIIAEQIPEQAPDTAPAAPSSLLYRTLIGLAIAVIAMALGYLAGPIVERRWARSPQAASTVSRQSAIDHDAKANSLGSLRSLADRGDADAQWQMGVRYHNGEGVPRDDAQAMQWFLRAAEQGHVTAQATLGAYYWAGRGVPQDLSKAYFWSAIALAQGDGNSKSRLEGLASQMTRAQVLAARQQAEAWMRSHNLRAKSDAN